MDDLRKDEGLAPDPAAFDEDRPTDGSDEDLNVSPASVSDLEDDLPDFQPGEGPGPTPGE